MVVDAERTPLLINAVMQAQSLTTVIKLKDNTMKKTYMVGIMLAFCSGVISKTVLDELGIDGVPAAYAEVAGMSWYDLRSDYDFKKAVKYIVERCDVDGDDIDC